MAVANLIGLSNNLLPIACEAIGYASDLNTKNNNEQIKIEFDDFEDKLINKKFYCDRVYFLQKYLNNAIFNKVSTGLGISENLSSNSF